LKNNYLSSKIYSITGLKIRGGENVVVMEVITNPIVLSGITILGRNIFGWLKNSLTDGEIQNYEWKLLAETLFKLGGLSLFLFLGLNVVVPGISAEESTAFAALIDVLRSQFKKEK